jgi:hypothetical protein
MSAGQSLLAAASEKTAQPLVCQMRTSLSSRVGAPPKDIGESALRGLPWLGLLPIPLLARVWQPCS